MMCVCVRVLVIVLLKTYYNKTLLCLNNTNYKLTTNLLQSYLKVTKSLLQTYYSTNYELFWSHGLNVIVGVLKM